MARNIVAERPAETASPVAMAVAMLIAHMLDASTEIVVPLAILIAFLPAAVTWLVEFKRGKPEETTYMPPPELRKKPRRAK